ncbi:MAG: hypothetical protein PHC61_08545, partial [Chitinivibrionales bacterium]|nr:hypothetical protein [Chitinivibrionales bacterium]
MARADLHVHSCFSDHPSEWFLQRLGARESYIEPEAVYAAAKNEGMDFVTLTDHNCIDGVLHLKERHPGDVFTGVEVTAYFPEDGAKIHVLIWGLTKEQFKEIDKIRTNLYDLQRFLVEQGLAHAVAHATFSINRRLCLEHIERLFVLFDNFETINGSRSRVSNENLAQVLAALTPEHLQDLAEKYFLSMSPDQPHCKGFVGGSDDHSGLFTGKTFTKAEAANADEFLARIKQKQTMPEGRHNDYQGLAFAIYKVAYDFYKSRSALSPSLFDAINGLIFDGRPIGMKNKFF